MATVSKPDYLQKLKVPEGYEKINDYSSSSAVSKPNFASNYALGSPRRDLQNALLCTVLVGSVWVKKYTKMNIEKMKNGKHFAIVLKRLSNKTLSLENPDGSHENGAKECIV